MKSPSRAELYFFNAARLLHGQVQLSFGRLQVIAKRGLVTCTIEDYSSMGRVVSVTTAQTTPTWIHNT